MRSSPEQTSSKKPLDFSSPICFNKHMGLENPQKSTTKNKPIFRVWMDSVARQNRPLTFRVFYIQALFYVVNSPRKGKKSNE
jgi:hypothetical protein